MGPGGPLDSLDAGALEELRRLLDVLDTIAAERLSLHGGDEQGAVMRHLLRQLLAGDHEGLPLFRLARLTGFPRETLRRKIGLLLNRGYVVQDEAGRYHCAPAYVADSNAARRRVIDVLRRFFAEPDKP